MKPQGLDIVDQLKRRIGGLCTENPADYTAFTSYDEVLKAIETINALRSALYLIGHDYVELSHDKVHYLYLEHMKIAKDAYYNSFPPTVPADPQPLDDNF